MTRCDGYYWYRLESWVNKWIAVELIDNKLHQVGAEIPVGSKYELRYLGESK